MCTSLSYRDAEGAIYVGRTMELDVEEPYVLAYVPAGQHFHSQVAGEQPVEYVGRHPFFAITVPEQVPNLGQPLDPMQLMAADGLNATGLTFSLLAYPGGGHGTTAQNTRAALQATDLGCWILSQFSNTDDVTSALKRQPVFRTRLDLVGGVEFPFHMVVHDRRGASIVIEWQGGEQKVLDNPVGVMTNGPEFAWHLTNLNNWTHLTNIDRSAANFGSLPVRQPDSGIATATLPSDNTSVGRFVRATYYRTFAEVVSNPDQALLTLAHVMDNFDRPRGITVAPPDTSDGCLTIRGVGEPDRTIGSTEYTSYTVLADSTRGLFLVRPYAAFNYTRLDLHRVSPAERPRLLPLAQFDALGGDGMDLLQRPPASAPRPPSGSQMPGTECSRVSTLRRAR